MILGAQKIRNEDKMSRLKKTKKEIVVEAPSAKPTPKELSQINVSHNLSQDTRDYQLVEALRILSTDDRVNDRWISSLAIYAQGLGVPEVAPISEWYSVFTGYGINCKKI